MSKNTIVKFKNTSLQSDSKNIIKNGYHFFKSLNGLPSIEVEEEDGEVNSETSYIYQNEEDMCSDFDKLKNTIPHNIK